jgi:hypothetical protein
MHGRSRNGVKRTAIVVTERRYCVAAMRQTGGHRRRAVIFRLVERLRGRVESLSSPLSATPLRQIAMSSGLNRTPHRARIDSRGGIRSPFASAGVAAGIGGEALLK